MELVKVDKIVREALFQGGYTIHWYTEFLSHALSCIRELNFDVMQNIKSVQLTPHDYQAVTLPCDYVDYVRVGELSGQYFSPWVEDAHLTREAVYEGGVRVAHPTPPMRETSGIDALLGFQNIYTNEWGEDMGRRYNNANGVPRNSFKVIRERSEIILADAPAGKIALEYITDGMNADASTCVHPYAVETIKSWIFWQYAMRKKHPNRSELRDEYYNTERILRGRMNPLDLDTIVRELRSANHGTIKQ